MLAAFLGLPSNGPFIFALLTALYISLISNIWNCACRGFLSRPVGTQTARTDTDRNFGRMLKEDGEQGPSAQINKQYDLLVTEF